MTLRLVDGFSVVRLGASVLAAKLYCDSLKILDEAKEKVRVGHPLQLPLKQDVLQNPHTIKIFSSCQRSRTNRKLAIVS